MPGQVELLMAGFDVIAHEDTIKLPNGAPTKLKGIAPPLSLPEITHWNVVRRATVPRQEKRIRLLRDLDQLGERGKKHVNLNVEEAAAYLQVSRATIYRWVASDYVPHTKLNGSLRFRLDVLDHWVERQSRKGRLTPCVVDNCI